MKTIKIILKREFNSEHVYVESNDSQKSQGVTIRLNMYLMEVGFDVTALGRTHLQVPGITESELQAVVNKYFNSDIIEVVSQ